MGRSARSFVRRVVVAVTALALVGAVAPAQAIAAQDSPVSPTITWPAPSDMLFGTALSAAQLDATASTAGQFVYDPPAGTVLQPGAQSLTAHFTPADSQYVDTAQSVVVNVVFSQPCITTAVHGGLRVDSGQSLCVGSGGKVTGPVDVKAGGVLWASGATITGPVSVGAGAGLWVESSKLTGPIVSTGAQTVTVCGSTMTGSSSFATTAGPLTLGGSDCAGDTVTGSVALRSNSGPVSLVGDKMTGSLALSQNSGALQMSGNTVTGSVLAPPSAPSSVAATAGVRSATVSWSAPGADNGSPVTSYTVTASPGGATATTADGSTTTATIADLTPGMSYTFTVAATNAQGLGVASATSNPVVPLGPPDSPTSVAAVAGDQQATVSWAPPAFDGGTPITSFVVTASPDGATVATADGGATSAVVPALRNGTAYTFTVVAVNDVGASAPSSQSSAVTPAGPPPAPTAVTAAPADSQADVTWTAPTDDNGSPISEYTVTADPGGATVTTSATNTTMTGLTDGVAYTFTVTATNGAGTSGSSLPSPAVTPLGPPDAPTDLTALPGDGLVKLSWNPPPFDGGSPVSSYTVTTQPGGAQLTVSAPATSATVSALTDGATYTFTVSATNAAGTGADSAASDPATPFGPPDAPTEVTATAGDKQATVNWTAPAFDGGSPVTSYTVTANPGGAQVTVPAPATSATVPGLTNGIAYTFTVSAVNAAGPGGASSPSQPVTPELPGPSTITLSVDHATFPLGGSSTLTATTDVNVAQFGDTITITDQTANTAVATCASGTTCTAHVTFPTGGPHTYVATVAALTSTPVTVSREPWVVGLAIDKSVFAAGDHVTLTATANQDVRATSGSYWIFIKDATTGQTLQRCSSGVTCTTTTSFLTGGPHSYTAVVTNAVWTGSGYDPGTDVQANSASQPRASRLAWTAALSIDKTVFAAGDDVTLTATANQDSQATSGSYWIFIKDATTGQVLNGCSRGTTCTATSVFFTGGPHSYTAEVANAVWNGSGYVPGTDVQTVSPDHPTASRLPWTVDLAVDKSVFAAGDHVTVTATVNQYPESSAYNVFVMDNITGLPVAWCYSGLACTGTTSFRSGGAHSYTAYVAPAVSNSGINYPGGDIQATSPQTVTARRLPWTLTMSASETNPTPGDTVTFVATANQDVANTDYQITLRDVLTGTLYGTCYTGDTCTFTVTTPYANNDSFVAYVAQDGWSADGPPDMQANSDGYSATTDSPAWSVTLAETPDVVGLGGHLTLTATANQDVAAGGEALYIFDTTKETLLASCATGSTCDTTDTYTGGQPDTYVAYVADNRPNVTSRAALFNTQAVSNPVTFATDNPYTVAGSTFNPVITLNVGTWNYVGDDPTGQYGVVDYDVTATIRGLGDAEPCETINGCSVVLEGGTVDDNNVIQPTSTLWSDPYGVYGPTADPLVEHAVADHAQVANQYFVRAAIYANGTLLADTPWDVASSFPVQNPGDVLAFAGASGTLIRKALQSQQDPCVEDFPTGTDVNGTSLNDLQFDCEGARIAGKSWSRVFATLAAKWGAGVIVTVGTTLGYLTVTAQSTADPNEDAAFLQRLNEFLERSQQSNSAFQTVSEADLRPLAKDVLERCDEAAARSGYAQSDCDTLPIFAPGVDVKAAAAHDFAAIATGRPAELNRISQGWGSWYTSWKDPNNPCYGGGYSPLHCDEYPFKSTAQGGPGRTPPTSLQLINAHDNTLEGTQLGAFYGCPTVQTGGTFLVVPMVSDANATQGFPTTAWC